jgi:type 1 glutamine amidotransferase
MTKACVWRLVNGFAVAAAGWAVFAADDIPAERARQIYDAAPAQPRVAPKAQRRVLIWNTPAHLMASDPHKGYCIPYGAAAFQALGNKTGAFKPVLSDDLAMFLPENLRQFDAIVLNNSSGRWITPTEADLAREPFRKYGADAGAVEQVLRRSLLEFVQRGGGLVCIHFAVAGNPHWPEFRELVGASFTGHPWNEEIGVCVEEPTHPLVAAFGGKDFRLADEIYEYGPPYDRSQVRVLLSLDPERSNMGVKWISRTDNDFALAWVKSVGRGRVFVTSFGHRTELFWDSRILAFYLDAIQFATGDLEAPTTPRADRPAKRAPGPTPAQVRAAKMQAAGVAEPSQEHVQLIQQAAPSQPAAKPAKPRRVLVWGHSWTHPPNPFAERALEALGTKSGAFQVVISDDPRLLLPDRLTRFDALVLNNLHEPEPFLPEDFRKLDAERQKAARQLDAAIKQSILEYVRGGRGLVGIHAATAALQGWPQYSELIGGLYAGHILDDVAIRVEDPAHPVNAVFAGKSWRIRDEIYIFTTSRPRDRLRVLLSLDLSQMPDPGKRPDKDYPVSWVQRYGDGRVFYTTLGHAIETYWNPLFLQHLLAGIQFALGDLPGPAEPKPGPTGQQN